MIAHAHRMPAAPTSPAATGAILVATCGRVLPLRATRLQVRAAGGLARVVLTQQFVNPHAEPLGVTYQVPLPADGAVAGYRFRIDEREVVGEIARREDAREQFVQAVMAGHTAALLEQDRSSVFTQEIGNLPPGATLDVELAIDQPLTWIAELGGTWEWRFPTVVAPRYMGAAGRVPDADRVTTHTTVERMAVAVDVQLVVDDAVLGVECPSHTMRTTAVGAATNVALADAAATLDRDVVVRWRVAGDRATTSVCRARPQSDRPNASDAFALVTLVPPASTSPGASVPRDLIVLLDTSGSMSGAPLTQAQRLACALVDQLGDADRLELIEFSTTARTWQPGPVAATATMRVAAKQWLAALAARGGTEMRTGIRAAIASLRPEAQRQVVLVTDGQIGFESEIVAEIHRALPTGCRVHTVGVGSAVNRSLTSPAARAGRGVEIVVGIDEDPERAIARLCAHTHAPLVVDLQLDGDALLESAPMHLPDLMAGQPATIAVRVRAHGGTLRVVGRTPTGTWEQRLALPPTAHGEGNPAIVTRFGREHVEDLELRIAAGEHGLDPQIEATGLAFAIATRHTSWIAIDHGHTVDVGAPTRHEVMPQALPHGMSASGVGLRPASAEGGLAESFAIGGAAMAAAPAKRKGMFATVVDGLRRRSEAPPAPGAPPPPSAARPRPSAAPMPAQGPAAPPPRVSAPQDAKLESEESADRTRAGTIDAALVTQGTFERLRDGTLVITFALDHGLPWRCPTTVALRLADGTRVTLAIDLARSTRDAQLTAGVQVRIVCPNAPAIDVVHATVELPPLRIVVSR